MLTQFMTLCAMAIVC